MKNRVRFCLSVLAAAFFACGLTSCKDDPENPAPEPEVTLTAGAATETSVSFTVTPVHADRCAWTYGLKGDAAPDAAAIFANGTAVSADQPSDVTIPDLTPGTTYVAYAVAASGEHAGEVESIDLPTVALSYDVDYTAQYAQGYYYGDRMSAGTGNYYFHLSQFEYAPVEGQEGEYPDAPGMDVVLDLYGAFADSPDHAILPDGVYEVDMQNPYGEGTVGTEYSTYYLIGDDLQLADQQSFRDLRVEVTTEDGVVSVVAIGELEDGRTLRVRYEGAPTVLKNGTTGLGENVQIDAMNLLVASYYGDEQKQGTGNYFLQFVSYEADDSGKPIGEGGYKLSLDLYGALSDDDDQAILPDGVYDIAAERYSEGSCYNMYTWLAEVDENGNSVAGTEFSVGTVTVARNGENYTLTANFRAEDGCVVEAKYEGPIDFENKVTGPVGDHKTNFTRGEVSYMGSTDEMSTFRLMLWDGNMLDRDDENDQYLFEEGRRNTMLFIDLYSKPCTSSSIKLEPGTYTVSSEGGPMTIDPGRLKVIVPGIIEESEGTYFYLTQANYPVATSMYEDGNTALIDGGTMRIDETGSGSGYRFTFDFTTKEGGSLTATMEGDLEFFNRAPIYSTLEDDYVVDLTDAECKLNYWGGVGEYGVWMVQIVSDEIGSDGFSSQIASPHLDETGIPTGTYTASKGVEPGTFLPGELSSNNMVSGTWYVGGFNGQSYTERAPAVDGEIHVTNNGDGTYVIDFECTDDAEVPHTFSGSWSGTAIYENAGNAVRSLVVSPNVPDEAGRAAVRAAKLTEARAAKPADTGKQKLSVVRAADNAGKALRASKY